MREKASKKLCKGEVLNEENMAITAFSDFYHFCTSLWTKTTTLCNCYLLVYSFMFVCLPLPVFSNEMVGKVSLD